MCTHHNYNIAYTTGLRVRTAITSAIYRKVQIVSRILCFLQQTGYSDTAVVIFCYLSGNY